MKDGTSLRWSQSLSSVTCMEHYTHWLRNGWICSAVHDYCLRIWTGSSQKTVFGNYLYKWGACRAAQEDCHCKECQIILLSPPKLCHKDCALTSCTDVTAITNLMWPMGEKLHEGMAGGVVINLQWRTIFWPGRRAQIILTCEWETPHYQGIPRESTLILSSPKLPSTDPPQWLWSGHFSHGEAIAVIQFFRNLFVKQALQTRFKGELRQWIGYF